MPRPRRASLAGPPGYPRDDPGRPRSPRPRTAVSSMASLPYACPLFTPDSSEMAMTRLSYQNIGGEAGGLQPASSQAGPAPTCPREWVTASPQWSILTKPGQDGFL